VICIVSSKKLFSLDEQIHFYANLFSTEGWDKNVAEELVTHMDRKLTCDESEDLEKDLTINEIKTPFSYQSTLALNLRRQFYFHNVSVFGFLSLLTLLIVAWRVQIYPLMSLFQI
jgi:hypothetical protein